MHVFIFQQTFTPSKFQNSTIFLRKHLVFLVSRSINDVIFTNLLILVIKYEKKKKKN